MQYTLSSSFPFSDSAVNSLMIDRNDVNVFPEPVGEETKMFLFLWISTIDLFWAGVKSSNFESNHFLTHGWSVL